MSAPNPQPLNAVQVAANLLARGYARGETLAGMQAAYPHVFASLSPAEIGEASLLGGAAAEASPRYGYAYGSGEVTGGDSSGQPGLAQGVYRVTLRFETGADVYGDPTYTYRTVLVGAAEFYTRPQIAGRGRDALAELVDRYGSDVPDVDPIDAEVVYEPFDLYQ